MWVLRYVYQLSFCKTATRLDMCQYVCEREREREREKKREEGHIIHERSQPLESRINPKEGGFSLPTLQLYKWKQK